MNAIRASFGFLTILPVGPRSGAGLESARAFFPLVGLVLGLALAGFDRMAHGTFGDELTAALLVVGLLAATRMLHIDGLMDSGDALLGGFSQERRLEILKDSRVGVFGAISGTGLVLLKWTALLTLAGPIRLPAIILFPMIARWCSVTVMQTFSYQSKAGIGSIFMENRSAWPTWVAATIAVAGSLAVGGAMGVILILIATATALLLGAWMARLLGGLTGDGYGAVVEVTEVVALIAAVALFEHWPELLDGRVEFPI